MGLMGLSTHRTARQLVRRSRLPLNLASGKLRMIADQLEPIVEQVDIGSVHSLAVEPTPVDRRTATHQ